ncbi:MAG: ClpXP protease specificity-enhancing factor SspB [Amaricoccus sp.]
MPKSINYRQLMKKAMHGFVADVLAQVARDGLPGKHYFFITFDTTHPGVDMNAALRARYPTEMTIVLQEWFADLAVMKDRFTVTLNFGNVPEPIVVPFEAIKTFVDPSVEFGVKFDAHDEDGPPEPAAEPETVVALEEAPAPAPAAKSGEAEVVRLDKFRKHEPSRP